MSFCLENKRTKNSRLKSFAKNKFCSLKILNLREFNMNIQFKNSFALRTEDFF